MNVYQGSQAKFMFKDDDFPCLSVGVFEDYNRLDKNRRWWVYWYSDGHIFDIGSADTEAEALKLAMKNTKQ